MNGLVAWWARNGIAANLLMIVAFIGGIFGFLSLEKEAFHSLGGFDESAAYGEDHLLVWKARQAGLRLKCTGADIATSARKYRERGWLKVTLQHLWLTACQATPQFYLLMKARIRAWFHGKAQSPSL